MCFGFCKTFSPCPSVIRYNIGFLKVHFRGVLLVNSRNFDGRTRSVSFNATLALIL